MFCQITAGVRLLDFGGPIYLHAVDNPTAPPYQAEAMTVERKSWSQALGELNPLNHTFREAPDLCLSHWPGSLNNRSWEATATV